MIKKGTVKIVDRYKGSQLIEKVYKGSDLIFDAFSEITGNLPLSFNSRVAGILKNYRIFGTAAGAGVQTINHLDVNAKDTANGYVANACLYIDGSENSTQSGYAISEYIPVSPSTQYSYCGRKVSGISLCFYNASKEYISGVTYTYARPRRFTSPSSAAYLRMTILDPSGRRDMLLDGDYDEEPAYEPFGYKIPLTLTSGQNTDTYPLYIGSTKLGEEEYADFGEQKVYKRTENLFDKDAQDYDNGFRKNRFLNTGGSAVDSGNFNISEYIPIASNKTYQLYYGKTANSPCVYLYTANKGTGTGAIQYSNTSPITFTTGSNDAYIRISYRKNAIDSTMLAENELPSSYIPYLQPTDPPVPFPAISVYQGENTLDSTETVGEVMVKGRISETAMLGRPSL